MNKAPAPYASPASTNGHSTETLQKYSCVLCSQRKVKCDRHDPCSACVKAAAQCLYVAPPPPRRGKRKTAEELQAARTKRYQEALQANSAASGDSNRASPASSGRTREHDSHDKDPERRVNVAEDGKLVVDGGKSKYIVNTLWKTLTDHQTVEHLSDDEGSSNDDYAPSTTNIDPGSFILGGSPNIMTVIQHPSPVHMFRLWQLFLDNVEPLFKIIHAPTVQQQILAVSNSMDIVSKPLEALMFGIYSLAVLSLDEAECDNIFGEPKSSLLPRYQHTTRQALINANFLRTSDLTVLQAYFFFLASIRQFTDAESFFCLSGIAVRIAERMGLHKDGAALGLSPYQVELRRRLWWQIVILDGQTAQLTGTSTKLLSLASNVKRPLNINDSDLYPDMKHVPAEHTGPTQMCFMLLRCDVCNWLQRNRPMSIVGGGEEPHDKTDMAKRDKLIDQVEQEFEDRYICNYDRSIPLHFLTMHVAALVICKIRWVAHSPQRWHGKEQDTPQEQKDMLLFTGLKILDCELLIQSNTSLKGFRWHSNSQAQWHTFVFILAEVRRRCDGGSFGAEVPRAWSLIEQTLETRTDVITDHKRPLHVAVCNTLLAAWEAYEKASNDVALQTPSCIVTLRARREAKLAGARARRQSSNSMNNTPTQSEMQQGFQVSPPLPNLNTLQPAMSNITNGWTMMPPDYDAQLFQPTDSFDWSAMNLNPTEWPDWETLLQSMDASGTAIGDQYLLR